MRRRVFLALIVLVGWEHHALAASNKKFAFKIKTKDGGIVGNVLIEASDVEAAKVKLMKRYPGCTILNVQMK